MAQKPGPKVPLQDRLAVQAELILRKRQSSLTEDSIGKAIKMSQAAVSKAMRGDLGEDVRDAFLTLWQTDLSTLRRKHAVSIGRVKHAENPEITLRAILENTPTHERLASTAAEAAKEAAEALAEDEGIPVLEAKALALDLLSESEAEPRALALYRAARRRLGLDRSSRPIS